MAVVRVRTETTPGRSRSTFPSAPPPVTGATQDARRPSGAGQSRVPRPVDILVDILGKVSRVLVDGTGTACGTAVALSPGPAVTWGTAVHGLWREDFHGPAR